MHIVRSSRLTRRPLVLLPLVVALVSGAGCTTLWGPRLPVATTSLVDSAGRVVGAATFHQTKSGVAIDLAVTGLRPGEHGVHIHAVGKCDPPAFTTAGGHFNPAGAHHGLQASGGPHAGDLPNLTANSAGSAHYTALSDRVTLGAGAASLMDADGSAIVIHAGPDDNVSDPAGNSGPRVACGVIHLEHY